MKQMSDSYLYQVADYGREIYKYLVRAERIDKNSSAFESIAYDVKMRQVSPVILKVLMSSKVVLCIDNNKGMSRAFKVIYANDVKDVNNKKNKKVFIDCTGLIEYDNGKYKCKNLGALLSYIITGMTYVLYYNIPKIIMNDSIIYNSSTNAFIDMMIYVLGYLKVPVTQGDNKERISYALAEYYLSCVFGLDDEENIINISSKLSKLDKRNAEYMHVRLADTLNEGNCNISDFIKIIGKIFLNQDASSNAPKNRLFLDADVLSQRWIYAYGSGTFLGLELFVPFSAILTDAYVGAYINQQNTVTKIAGKNLVVFTNELLKIGSENA